MGCAASIPQNRRRRAAPSRRPSLGEVAADAGGDGGCVVGKGDVGGAKRGCGRGKGGEASWGWGRRPHDPRQGARHPAPPGASCGRASRHAANDHPSERQRLRHRASAADPPRMSFGSFGSFRSFRSFPPKGHEGLGGLEGREGRGAARSRRLPLLASAADPPRLSRQVSSRRRPIHRSRPSRPGCPFPCGVLVGAAGGRARGCRVPCTLPGVWGRSPQLPRNHAHLPLLPPPPLPASAADPWGRRGCFPWGRRCGILCPS